MSYSSTILADSPRGYWRMDDASGNIQDSSGNAHHATSTVGLGAAVYSEPGAISTDPTSTSIKVSGTEPEGFAWDVPDHADLDLGDVFTLECWVKRLAISSTYTQMLICKQANAYGMRIATDNTLQLLRNDVLVMVSSTATIAETTNWHHVAATKNGATVKLYIDGSDVTGSVTNDTCTDNTNGLRIGAYYGGGEMFQGWLDEVAIYPTALSQSALQAHIAAASAEPPTLRTVRSSLRW